MYEGKPRPGSNQKGTYMLMIRPKNDVRKALTLTKQYLELKQKQAELALEMLDISDVRDEGWKERTKVLAGEISRLNHQPLPNIDLDKLAHGTIMVKRRKSVRKASG